MCCKYFWIVNSKFLKTAAVTALAFVAYRAYKLWELMNSFSYRYTGLYFERPKNVKELLNSFGLVLEMAIMNPTSTSIKLSGVNGGIYYKGTLIGTFNIGNINVLPSGDTPIKVRSRISTEMAARIVSDIAKKEFPVFDIHVNVNLLFGLTKKIIFNVNSKDYLPSNTTNVFA